MYMYIMYEYEKIPILGIYICMFIPTAITATTNTIMSNLTHKNKTPTTRNKERKKQKKDKLRKTKTNRKDK